MIYNGLTLNDIYVALPDKLAKTPTAFRESRNQNAFLNCGASKNTTQLRLCTD